MDDSYAFLATSPTQIPDPSHPQVVDDDALSLFGGRDIDQDDHRGTRNQDDQIKPGTDPGQASLDVESNQVGQEDLPSSDAFLESIDCYTTISAPKGPPVGTRLATLVNARFQKELESSQRKQIKAKHLVPENCNNLFWPPVNEQVWNSLKTDAKGAERTLVTMQDTLVSASGAIATTLNDLLLARDNSQPLDYKANVSRLIDVVSLLGAVCRELSYRRKETLRPYLSNEFKFACNRSTKPDKFLFGNDISKTMQDVKAMGKIVQKFPQKPRGGSQYRASAPKSSTRNYGPPFLSQKGRMQYPPRRAQGQLPSAQPPRRKPWSNWTK